ncbi:MAG: sigma-70 family RNA polymerase sigma factor, partial [Planctomycetales bacterium]
PFDADKGTRLSFIQQLGDGDGQAWEELNRLYRPLICNWLRRFELQPSDVEDLTQDVMIVVASKVDEFSHNGRLGAFRAWLRTTTVHLTMNFLRKKRPASVGSNSFLELQQLNDAESELSREFNREHDRHVVKSLLKKITPQFKPSTVEAFRLHVVEEMNASQTAQQLGLTVKAVHIAKSRVLRRLRESAADWFDDLEIF